MAFKCIEEKILNLFRGKQKEELRYIYFVSYKANKDNEKLMGCCEIGLKKPVKSFDDIRVLIEIIEKNNGFKNVTIINYKRLKSKSEKFKKLIGVKI